MAPFAPGSFESVGAIIALVLVVALGALLPAKARSLLRQPVLFLLIFAVAQGILTILPDTHGARRAASLASLTFLLASIGRSGVVLVLEVILGQRLIRPLPRIIRDIAQGLVYIAILLTVLRAAGFEPGSLLTTSALITAAVALSLQETLGNMVAGLAIQVQRPFAIDDWIQFDPETKHVGRVIEINWRATKVITLDEVEVTVPNATLAKAPIVNFTKPTATSRRSLYLQVPADVPPLTVQRSILDALEGSFGIVAEPPPSVVTNAFVEGNVEYWVRFFTDKFDKRDGVDGAARDRIWYAFARAGIPRAFPNRTVELHEISDATRAKAEEDKLKSRHASLGTVDFLRVLGEEQRMRLAFESSIHLYAPGEIVVHQGDKSAVMFIVESGEVVVERERGNGKPEELARVGAGGFFGEMALMTGEPRNATVRAAVACKLIRIDGAALRTVFASAPDVAEHVSRVIAERQESAPLSMVPPSGRDSTVEERSSLLLGRIRRFFSL
jgi:small-conductance mechanosensitive channel/CRP-like cAMP-binding protein